MSMIVALFVFVCDSRGFNRTNANLIDPVSLLKLDIGISDYQPFESEFHIDKFVLLRKTSSEVTFAFSTSVAGEVFLKKLETWAKGTNDVAFTCYYYFSYDQQKRIIQYRAYKGERDRYDHIELDGLNWSAINILRESQQFSTLVQVLDLFREYECYCGNAENLDEPLVSLFGWFSLNQLLCPTDSYSEIIESNVENYPQTPGDAGLPF